MKNPALQDHAWLEEMYQDAYFPDVAVDMVRGVLLNLCATIEAGAVSDLDALYPLTHHATEQINALAEVFYDHDSEIETAARECIAAEFDLIARTFGFPDADLEELIAPRDW